jgi:hypothetical protein
MTALRDRGRPTLGKTLALGPASLGKLGPFSRFCLCLPGLWLHNDLVILTAMEGFELEPVGLAGGVYFRCSACGQDHRSSLQADQRIFERIGPHTRTDTCPVTGHAVTYDKSRMRWQQPSPKNARSKPETNSVPVLGPTPPPAST